MGKKNEKFNDYKAFVEKFEPNELLTTVIRIHHQPSTTHETLHYLSSLTTKLRGMNFKKILSPKSNHHNYTKENHAPSTLKSIPYQSSYRSKG